MKTVPDTYGKLIFDEIEHNSSESERTGYNQEKGTFTAGYDGLYHFRTGSAISFLNLASWNFDRKIELNKCYTKIARI